MARWGPQPLAWLPSGQADIRALIRQFEPVRISRGGGPPRPVNWNDLPHDIVRLVAGRLPPQDVQAALLTCREWHAGFASGVTVMRPRVFMVQRLAQRCVREKPRRSLPVTLYSGAKDEGERNGKHAAVAFLQDGRQGSHVLWPVRSGSDSFT